MIHSTGTAQDDPYAYFNGFNSPSRKASVHGFVSAKADGIDFLQTMPYNYKAWHCGGSGNSRYIGIELCESDHMRYTGGANFKVTNDTLFRADILRAYDRAVELCAELCNEYGWDPMTRITTHKEGHQNGIASNHADPDHVWSRVGKTIATFREDVEAAMRSEVMYNTVQEVPAWARDSVIWAINKGALGGTTGKKDSDGYPIDLNLSSELTRTLVIVHRLMEG